MLVGKAYPSTMRAPIASGSSTAQSEFAALLGRQGGQITQPDLSSPSQATVSSPGETATYLALQRAVTDALPHGASLTGGRELTEDQVEALKEQYDITNLSPEEEFAFFKDLLELGAISFDDFLTALTAKIGVPNGQSSMLRASTGTSPLGGTDLRNVLQRMLAVSEMELESYHYLLSAYDEDRQDLKAYAEAHQRLYEFLLQFER